jgi:hypothetical protein
MGKEGVFTGFWLGGPKVRDHWEDKGVGGRITLRRTLVREIDGENWIRLDQDRVQWRASVNTIQFFYKNIISCVGYKCSNFCACSYKGCSENKVENH